MTEQWAVALSPLASEAAPLRRKIVTAVQEAIEAGVLKPGTRIVERELCEQLVVSRTSIREALRELEARGVVVRIDGKLTVPIADQNGLKTAYQIRLRLETLVMENLLEHASDQELKEVAVSGTELATAYEEGTYERITRSRSEFYRRVFAGSRAPLAAEFLNSAMQRTFAARGKSLAQPHHRRRSADHVRSLTSAIAERNVESTRKALEQHISDLADAALMAAHRPSGGNPPR